MRAPVRCARKLEIKSVATAWPMSAESRSVSSSSRISSSSWPPFRMRPPLVGVSSPRSIANGVGVVPTRVLPVVVSIGPLVALALAFFAAFLADLCLVAFLRSLAGSGAENGSSGSSSSISSHSLRAAWAGISALISGVAPRLCSLSRSTRASAASVVSSSTVIP